MSYLFYVCYTLRLDCAIDGRVCGRHLGVKQVCCGDLTTLSRLVLP